MGYWVVCIIRARDCKSLAGDAEGAAQAPEAADEA